MSKSLSFEPLHVPSLKETCVAHLEELILSGELAAGEKLPSERDLAERLGISRPVLHEALVDLAAKGLVSILPRRGVVVNDYRKVGSIAILSSLLDYHQGSLEPHLVESLFQMRILVETETARLAARTASAQDVAELTALHTAEQAADRHDSAALTELDFQIHLLISIVTGNLIYPLIINSFKKIYTHFTSRFFEAWQDTPVIEQVFEYHRRLIDAIARREPGEAAQIMAETLAHGERYLKEGGSQ
jgi:GntR family transcriptional regulator, transcriptional repressor for pyruvate dehydrogenase complex